MSDPAATTAATDATQITDARVPREVLARALGEHGGGRYAFIAELGAGAMGRVVRAYDPKLRREVALKRVLPQALGIDGEARLVREAQAMAQLSHPNVVAVHDVESEGDAVTLVMEYVAGGTLAKWLEADRSPEEIVDAFFQAGRGLAAAHAVGLVHRDFKPSNVLVAEDGGRPLCKVTDFGLAKLAGPDDASDTGRLAEPSIDITAAGTVVGTPKYMAPEQHAGAAIDARTDQYAFCLALREALTGRYPFAYGSVEELANAKHTGPGPWPRSNATPRRVVDALDRGLRPEPGERWPSMDALLAGLAPPKTGGRWWLVALAGVAVTGGLATAVALRGGGDPTAALCTGADAALVRAWDATRRERVEAALRATGVAFAETTVERVSPRLQTWADAWAQQHRDACEATAVRGEQSAQVMDLRMVCLADAMADFRAKVDLLERADAYVAERAIDIVDALPRLERCTDVEALRDVDLPPLDLRDEVQAARAQLSRATALEWANETHEAEAALARLQREAEALGYEPLVARIMGVRGEILETLGRREEAEAQLRGALRRALRHGPQGVALGAGASLLYILGHHDQRFAEANLLRDILRPMARAHGDPFVEGGTLEAIASILADQGEYDEARREYERALDLLVTARGRQSHNVATVHNNLGGVLRLMGRYADAKREQERALAIWTDAYGADHPTVAHAEINLGVALSSEGAYGEAEPHIRTAIANIERSLGADHPSVPTAHGNLGIVLVGQGRIEEGLREHRLALRLLQQHRPAGHPDIANAHSNVGVALLELGRPEAAETEFRAALRIYADVLPPEHPQRGITHTNVGSALEGRGELAEAEREHERALAILTEGLDPEHPTLASVRANLAGIRLERGKPELALEELDRVWPLVTARRLRGSEIGRLSFLRARVLKRLGRDESEVRPLAANAAQAYRGAEGDHEDDVAEIEAWIEAQLP